MTKEEKVKALLEEKQKAGLMASSYNYPDNIPVMAVWMLLAEVEESDRREAFGIKQEDK